MSSFPCLVRFVSGSGRGGDAGGGRAAAGVVEWATQADSPGGALNQASAGPGLVVY
jgi:hypothetical protein